MALTYNWTRYYSDSMPAKIEDFAPVIYESNPLMFPALTLAKLAAGARTTLATTHSWREKANTPFRSTLNGAISNSDTTIVFNTAAFKPGQKVRLPGETVLLGTTSDNLTFASCTRGVGASSGVAHADAVKAIGVGKAEAQGSDSTGSPDLLIEEQTVTSYTKITKRLIDLSGSAMGERQHGRSIPKWQWATMKQGEAMMREQERDLFYAVAAAPVAGSTAGSFDGFDERIVAAGNTADAGGNVVTYEQVKSAITGFRDYEFAQPGFARFVMFCSPTQRTYFDSLGEAKVQYVADPNDPVVQVFGTGVKYLRVLGVDVLLQDLSWMDTDSYLIDFSQVAYMPYINEYVNREMMFEPLGKTIDGERAHLISENILEYANPVASGFKWYDVSNS